MLPGLEIQQVQLQGTAECAIAAPDGRHAIVENGSEQRNIWNFHENFIRTTPRRRPIPVKCVALSPDGSRGLDGCQDGSLFLWEWATGADLKCLRGQQGEVKAVAFSRDGCFAVSGGLDACLYVWNLQSGELHLELPTNASDFIALTWYRDRNVLIATGDGCIVDANVQRALETTRWKLCVVKASAAAFTAGAQFVAVGDPDGMIRLWKLVDISAQEAYRPA